LTPLLAWRRPFYVLALDQQGARLWESHGESLGQRRLACNDESVESLAPDRRTDGTLQFRSSAESGGNADSPMFHGQAPEDEGHEADVKRFLTEVDRCVCDEVGRDPGPLVLACVAELRAAYRGLDPIPEPLEGYIEGSPNDHSPDELYREAIKVIEEFERGARAKLVDRYGEAVGKELALHDPEEIVVAAGRGQVDTLMLADPRPGEAKTMCREAIRRVLLSSGDVCTVSAEEMPVDSPLAAILRYTLTPEASSRA